MTDGLYQSVICFFMPYMLYKPANFATESGRDISDRTRMGVLIATCAVLASNTYIMMNTYRWDWFTGLINVISSLLIFFWTGVYAAFTGAGQFYQAAGEVYGALSFWVVLLVTCMIALLPRFSYNAVMKVFFPLDVDIIREQVTMGKYKHLEENDEIPIPPPKAGEVAAVSSNGSATSSEFVKPIQPTLKQDPFNNPHEERAFYSPTSTANGAHTNGHNPRSQNGSNGTNYTASLDQYPRPQSVDYVQRSRSHDRTRHSFERVRQSFEQSNDFTSAAMLQRMESSHNNENAQDPFRAPGEPHGHNLI
jgi:phospholipid-translocating ATPase